MSDHDRVVGAVLSAALDDVKATLREPDKWNLSLFLGHKDDPQVGYLVGNMNPDQLNAALASLVMDGHKLGTINAHGKLS